MSIRSIDIQTMVPKTLDVQKVKSAEAHNPNNNQMINVHKEQQQHQQNLKQVNHTDKPYNAKIDKEKEKNNKKNKKKSKKEKDDENDDNKEKKIMTKIDILI